jgi:soluble lytic murein transglycosylase-like protein
MPGNRPGTLTRQGFRAVICLALAAFVAPGVSGAEVYKYVDENGILNFTNIEPPSSVDYTTMKFPCYASDSSCRKIKWDEVPLNTSAFESQIRSAAVYNHVDESLIRAIIHAESAYHPDAVSPKGAQGLMQLMPETQAVLNVRNPFDPAHNIAGGVRHLSALLREFEGDISLAAAAYNAGSGAVKRYGGVPPFAETREYVRRVKILYRRYQDAVAGA